MQQFSVVWGKAGASAGAEAPIFSEACTLFHGRVIWRQMFQEYPVLYGLRIRSQPESLNRNVLVE
ncbi:hypothetical protein, partial [uncultured Akkermansia sp.]